MKAMKKQIQIQAPCNRNDSGEILRSHKATALAGLVPMTIGAQDWEHLLYSTFLCAFSVFSLCG
jgi:hypothetical protein